MNPMKVIATNILKVSDLPKFVPVEGRWQASGSSDDRDRDSIIQAIENHFSVSFPLDVQLFHADGGEIQSEMPCDGIFLATRILTRKTQ